MIQCRTPWPGSPGAFQGVEHGDRSQRIPVPRSSIPSFTPLVQQVPCRKNCSLGLALLEYLGSRWVTLPRGPMQCTELGSLPPHRRDRYSADGKKDAPNLGRGTPERRGSSSTTCFFDGASQRVSTTVRVVAPSGSRELQLWATPLVDGCDIEKERK